MAAPIITDPEAMTPEWLSEVLGGPFESVTISGLTATPVGTGQMGDSVRLALTHDGGPAVPSSVVAKLPAADATSRATAAAVRSYEIEVSYYRLVAPTVDMRTPLCYHAAHDPDTDAFVLLLEDMAPAEQGDQLRGCTVREAEIAVDELPKLHAPRWGDPALEGYDWLARNSPDGASATGALVTMLWDGFRPRYDGRIDPEIMELGARLIAGLPVYLSHRPEPFTVAHGDYRLDNLLFAVDETGPPVAVVDWQTVALGPGVSDLSYFVGAGLVTEERREHERALVDRYRDGLATRGVALDAADLWEQYRRFTFAGLIMAIAASMLVEQTERGDDMFITMAERHGRHALDLDADEFLG